MGIIYQQIQRFKNVNICKAINKYYIKEADKYNSNAKLKFKKIGVIMLSQRPKNIKKIILSLYESQKIPSLTLKCC